MKQSCVAVIFISRLRGNSPGYEETARQMVELVRERPGFLGMESWRNDDGYGNHFLVGR